MSRTDEVARSNDEAYAADFGAKGELRHAARDEASRS